MQKNDQWLIYDHKAVRFDFDELLFDKIFIEVDGEDKEFWGILGIKYTCDGGVKRVKLTDYTFEKYRDVKDLFDKLLQENARLIYIEVIAEQIKMRYKYKEEWKIKGEENERKRP